MKDVKLASPLMSPSQVSPWQTKNLGKSSLISESDIMQSLLGSPNRTYSPVRGAAAAQDSPFNTSQFQSFQPHLLNEN